MCEFLFEVYGEHRRWMQFIAWSRRRATGTAARRWVFKLPWHVRSLPALLKVYPDAVLVHTVDGEKAFLVTSYVAKPFPSPSSLSAMSFVFSLTLDKETYPDSIAAAVPSSLEPKGILENLRTLASLVDFACFFGTSRVG